MSESNCASPNEDAVPSITDSVHEALLGHHALREEKPPQWDSEESNRLAEQILEGRKAREEQNQ